MNAAVKAAYELIQMHEELQELRFEVRRLKEVEQKFQNHLIMQNHESAKAFAGWIDTAIKKGSVLE